MENEQPKSQQTVSWWITSLAISVACCAVLFVIFAGYLNDIKKQLASQNTQLEQMTEHQEKLLSEIQALHAAMTPKSASDTANTLTPTATHPADSVSPVVPSVALTPSEAAAPVPAGTTAPTITVPAPLSPAAVPEIPAKH